MGECDELIGEVERIASYARNALSLSDGDIERACRLWRSMRPEEREEFIGRAVKSIAGLLKGGPERDMVDVVRRLLDSFETICENSDSPAVGFLLAAANAMVSGLSIAALSLAVAGVAGLMLSKAASEEDRTTVFKYSMWCLTVLVSSYNLIESRIMLKASGVPPRTLENLVIAYSRDLEEKIRSAGARRRGQDA